MTGNGSFTTEEVRSVRPSRALTLLSFVLAWATTILLLRLGEWEDTFRNGLPDFFSFDQLAYTAISVNASNGVLSPVEPFTQTGLSIYPSWWYVLNGAIAGATGIPVLSLSALLGLVLVLLVITYSGFVSLRASGAAWAPLIPAALIWTGPLALAISDSWYISLDSHGVLWGPYGLFLPLNAESAATALGSVALLRLLHLFVNRDSPRKHGVLNYLVIGLIIGLLGNFHTYAFLGIVTIASVWLLAFCVMRSSSPWHRVVLIVPAALVLVAGPLLRPVVGALPLFALVLVAATLPSFVILLRGNHVRQVVFGLAGFGVGFLPQVILVAQAYIQDLPFLSYRTEQSGDLGVTVLAWLLASVGLLLVGVWVWYRLRGNVIARSLLIALLVSNVVLSFNNVWGFGQEPYRFWIGTYTISVIVMAPLIARSLTEEPAPPGSGLRAIGLVGAVILALSTWNVGGFRDAINESGFIDLESPHNLALSELTVDAQGTFAAEPCIDPGVMKLASGQAVAYYSPGIAWPTNKSGIDRLLTEMNASALTAEGLDQAGVDFFVTDSSCGIDWGLDRMMGVLKVSEIPYTDSSGNHTLVLWRIA